MTDHQHASPHAGSAERAEYSGRFGIAAVPGFEVTHDGTTLRLGFPGAPDWLYSRLEHVDGETFVAADGPLRGAGVAFARDEDGRVARLELTGRIVFPRHPADDPPSYSFLPPSEPDPERDLAFDALFARAVAPGTGDVVEYDLPYPKHAFLDDLCRRHGLLLHGSRVATIETFEPRADTLGPTRERSLLAVSACSDGIWPIAYAILDRSRARGAFHNGVLELRTGSRGGRIYHFSIHEGHFALEPSVFIDGMVYVFPPDGFRRVTDGPIGLGSLEFVREAAVAPLARLRVSRSDFPLPICGHDDSPVLAALEFVDRMYVECQHGEAIDDGFELRFEPRAGLDADLARLARIFGRFYPWAQAWVGASTFRLTGSPGLRRRISQGFARARRRP